MIGAKTFFHFRDDRVRIFLARIIRGDDGVIGVKIDHLSHERPLLRVAISAAAKNYNQATRLEFTQRFQNVEQRIGVCA